MKINGKQAVKLRSGLIKFKNHFKQLAAPFKIYADLECNLEQIHTNKRGNDTSYTEKYQDHIPNSFGYKVVCADDNLSKTIFLFLYEVRMQFINSLMQFLKRMIIAKDDE